MRTKIKIKDISDLTPVHIITIRGDTHLFNHLNTYVQNTLTNVYNVTNYNESMLYKLLNSSNSLDLSIAYFISRSADKYISPLFEKLLKIVESGDMSSEDMYKQLCNVIAHKYAFNWLKISNAITTDYKPLENYDLNEERKVNTDMNVHQESESGIYGFNSTESQPTATGTGDTNTIGLKADNEELLTRHGNIGVTTSQQMLESEINLRQYNFIEQIFKDIDNILCLKIY